jgi:hypothetical protein
MMVYLLKVSDWGMIGHVNKGAQNCSVTLLRCVYFLQLRDCSGLNLFLTLNLESDPSIGLPLSVAL